MLGRGRGSYSEPKLLKGSTLKRKSNTSLNTSKRNIYHKSMCFIRISFVTISPTTIWVKCSHFADKEIESQGSSVTCNTDIKERWLLFVVLFLLTGLTMRAQAGLQLRGYLLQPLFRGTGMHYSAR